MTWTATNAEPGKMSAKLAKKPAIARPLGNTLAARVECAPPDVQLVGVHVELVRSTWSTKAWRPRHLRACDLWDWCPAHGEEHAAPDSRSGQESPDRTPVGGTAAEVPRRALLAYVETDTCDRQQVADGQAVTKRSRDGTHVSLAWQANSHASRVARSQSSGTKVGARVGVLFRGSEVSTQRRYSCWRSTSRWGAGVHIVVISAPPP